MWKSFFDAVIESLAMSDPVAYMHYLDCKRNSEPQTEIKQDREPNRPSVLQVLGATSPVLDEFLA
jgi:hypothetical protein